MPDVAGLGDDLGFFGVILGVEHRGFETVLGQGRSELFGFGDVLRADEDRLAGLVDFADFLYDGGVLVLHVDEDLVRLVDTDVRSVLLDDRHAERVELLELVPCGESGARHPRHP